MINDYICRMKRMTKEELMGYVPGMHLTVGDLKAFIEKHDLPDDAIVVTQRVYDAYFEGGHDISGMRSAEGILPKGSRSSEWGVYCKDTEEGEEQYYPLWCCVKYSKETDILFLDVHC